MTRAKDISKIITDADLSGTLDVTGAVTASGLTVEGSTAPTINIKSTDAVVVADDVVGAITFEESDATGGTGVQAFIKAIANDSGNTYDMSIGVGGNTEAIRVDQSGSVGIGNSSPTQKLEVSGKGVFSTANPDVNGLKITATTGTNASAMTFSNTATAYVGLDNSVGGRISGVPYGLVVWNGSAYPVVFGTNGTERMRIDASGNVGIGTSSPNYQLHATSTFAVGASGFNQQLSFTNDTIQSLVLGSGYTALKLNPLGGNVGIGTASPADKLHIVGSNGATTRTSFQTASQLVVENNSDTSIDISTGTTHSGYLNFHDTDAVQQGYIGYGHTNDLMVFGTNGSERIRIHNDGSVSIGSTSKDPQNGGSSFLTESLDRRTLRLSQSGTGNANIAVFFSGGNLSGTINISSGSTTYGSGSDYRIKENIVDLTDATTRLKQLKPKRFNFITNPDDEARDGFLAHEVSSIVPEAVIGEKDAVDENGEIIVQQLDPSKLVPLLVKTIQELEARIVALETA